MVFRPQYQPSVHWNISYPVSRAFCRSFGILCYFALVLKANAFQLRFVAYLPLIAVSLEDYICGYAISNDTNAAYYTISYRDTFYFVVPEISL